MSERNTQLDGSERPRKARRLEKLHARAAAQITSAREQKPAPTVRIPMPLRKLSQQVDALEGQLSSGKFTQASLKSHLGNIRKYLGQARDELVLLKEAIAKKNGSGPPSKPPKRRKRAAAAAK
jgi:hypothetical protein